MIIGLFLTLKFAYSFRSYMAQFTGGELLCPQNHLYVPDLYPHTCIGMSSKCLGVTQVNKVIDQGQEYLCHPRFQAYPLTITVMYGIKIKSCILPKTLVYSYDQNGLLTYKCQSYPNINYCFLSHETQFKVKCEYCFLYYNTLSCTVRMDGINDQMKPCPTNCLACDAAATYCTSCMPGQSKLNSDDKLCSYKCKDGHSTCSYDASKNVYTFSGCMSGYESISGDCQKCPDNCLSCKNKVCNQCQIYFSLLSGKCFGDINCQNYIVQYDINNAPIGGVCQQCDFGYFNNGLICQLCNSIIGMEKCFLCDNSTECKSCTAGYHLNSNKQCIQYDECDTSCQTCLPEQPTFCTSCDYVDFRTADQGKCLCDEKNNYADKDGICTLCTKGYCLTCTQNFYECKTCKGGSNRSVVGDKCICDPYFYDSGASSQICSACHTTCFNCSGPYFTQCTLCDDPNVYHRELINGQCQCQIGYTEQSPIKKQCAKCHNRCAKCSKSLADITIPEQQYCTKCYDGQNRILSSKLTCDCIKNFGDNFGASDRCFQCFYTCGLCSGETQYECTSCTNESNRYLTNTNECKCKQSYYEEYYGKMQCKKCHYSCLECNFISEVDQCTLCSSSRMPSSNNSTFKCICKNSNYFDDGQTMECQQCHFSCLTCNGPAETQCLTCDTNYREKQFSKCECPTGKYDIGQLQCADCHKTCEKCFGDKSDNCISCSSTQNRTIKGNTCVCMSGSSDNNGALVACQKCSYRCNGCLNRVDNCVSCAADSYRILGADQSCQCPPNLLDMANNPICQSCHYTCKYCSGGSQNQCLSCKDLTFRTLNSQNQCACNTRYYDVGYSECQPCGNFCSECLTLPDNCTSCTSDRYLVNNKCKCKTKTQGLQISTFQFGTQVQCLKCHFSCLTCSGISSKECLSCEVGEFRTQNGSSCVCIDGYFDSGQSACWTCSPKCKTCSQAQDMCTSCPDGSLRIINVQLKKCQCPTGYYDDGVNIQCQKCHYSCVACSSSANRCEQCNELQFRYYNSQLFTCDCLAGYYDNGIEACQKCHYSCSECYSSGPLNCKTCRSQILSQRVLNSKKCLCVAGYFDDGSNTDCLKCSFQCSTCNNYSYNCTSCSETRTLVGGNCNCRQGYFESGINQCSLCDKNCKECQVLQNKCTACYTDKYRILNTQNNTCICQDGYTEINGICEQCGITCKTCSLSIDNCTSCPDLRSLVGSQCLCIDGFYQAENKQCLICHKSCQTCMNQDDYCTSCSALNHRILQVGYRCECQPGYFENEQTIICEKCDFSCLTCSISSINCLTCNSILHRALNSNKCVCQSGYYLNATFNLCQNCDTTCLECESAMNCTACREDTRNFDVDNQKCPCKSNYYENNSINCNICDYSCKTCQNGSSQCTSCEILYYRKLINNTCLCQDGYYDAGIDICQKCSNLCKTCQLSSTRCLSCFETEQIRILESNSCKCKNGYFENEQRICQQCSNQCLTCIGKSDICTTCDINQKRIDQSAINKCPCIYGYYSDINYECQKCHIKCSTCVDSSENCITCHYDLKSYRQSISGQCNCKDGYFDDGIQFYCQVCNSKCKTCVSNSTNCLSCSNNLRFHPPTCNCINGYFENAQNVCQICSNQCSTCLKEPSNCITCKIGRQGKDCQCGDGYFEAGLINCQICDFKCLTCVTNNSNCLTCKGDRINAPNCQCQDGWFDDFTNENCQLCDHTCLLCDQDGCLSCAGKRELSPDKSCDPPPNSICYDDTPWCSTCEVAVLDIYFSNDLNSILVNFDFPLNDQIFSSQFQNNVCNQIIESTTFDLLGNNPLCTLNEEIPKQMIISLGSNAQIIVSSELNFKFNVLKHIDCDVKLQTFILNQVQMPKEIMVPVIGFKLPTHKISPCYDFYVNQNIQSIDGKRKLVNIKWSYLIINQDTNIEGLDNLVQQNTNSQSLNLIISASIMPINSQIQFSVFFANFLGTSSTTQFILTTNSGDYPSSKITTKPYYMPFQIISLDLTILTKYCTGTAIDAVENRQISLSVSEYSRNPSESTQSNLQYQVQNTNTYSHQIKISQYTLSPDTIYTFEVEIQDVELNHTYVDNFDINVISAGLLCDFGKTPTIQNYKKEFTLFVKCKDLDYELDWNKDNQISTQLSCIDQTTLDNCKDQSGKLFDINENEKQQDVPKFSFQPFSIQVWEIKAVKGNKIYNLKQSIVYLDDSIQEQEIEYNSAYQMRPVNNYEQLSFKFIVDDQDKKKVLEYSVAIIYDYEIVKILRPQYEIFKTKIYQSFQDFNLGDYFQLRFNVQFSNNIMPKLKNLKLSINQPPVCQNLNVQSEESVFGLVLVNIVVNCQITEDSPYYYQLKQFLSENDLESFLKGNTDNSFLFQKYQLSNTFQELLSLPYNSKKIIILVQVLDQKGSITNLLSENTPTLQNKNCPQTIPTNFKIKEQISLLIHALRENCTELAQQLKTKFIQLMQDLSNSNLNLISKSIQLYNQVTQKSSVRLETERVLDETSQTQDFCYDSGNSYFIDQRSSQTQSNSTEAASQIITDSSQIQSQVVNLNKLSTQIEEQIAEDSLIWNEQLVQEQQMIFDLLITQIYLIDDQFVEIGKIVNNQDEKIYNANQILLNLIHDITNRIQVNYDINKDSLQINGNLLTLNFKKTTMEYLGSQFNLTFSYEKNIVSYCEIEELKFTKFNPYNYSQELMTRIRTQLKSPKIKFFHGPFSRNIFTNNLIDGRSIEVQQFYTNFSIFQIQVQNCEVKNQTKMQFQFVCLVRLEDQEFTLCNIIIQESSDDQQTITCFCQYFGDIFLIQNFTYQEQTHDEITVIMVNQNTQSIFTTNIFYFQIGSSIFFITIVCLLLFFEIRKVPSEESFETVIEFQKILYPSHYRIFLKNFKFVHQSISLFYHKDNTIKKSFLFLKLICQVSILQAVCLVEIPQFQSENIDNFLYTLCINIVVYQVLRAVNKIFEAMFRFKGVSQILSYIVLYCEVILPDILYLTQENFQNNSFIIYLQLFIYSFLLTQLLVEPALVYIRIIVYKHVIHHFRIKLFNPFYHLIYFFVIHSRLDEIMNQYIQL